MAFFWKGHFIICICNNCALMVVSRVFFLRKHKLCDNAWEWEFFLLIFSHRDSPRIDCAKIDITVASRTLNFSASSWTKPSNFIFFYPYVSVLLVTKNSGYLNRPLNRAKGNNNNNLINIIGEPKGLRLCWNKSEKRFGDMSFSSYFRPFPSLQHLQLGWGDILNFSAVPDN